MAYLKEGVKHFTSEMQGAPTLSGTVAGNRLQLLDACLVDGFGLLSVTSITVAAGVATLTVGAGHAYKLHSVLLIAGVTGALTGLNGQFKLTAVTGTTCTFPCPAVANGTAAGSITAKIAPLGWLKSFSGTNLAVYKSSDPFSNGHSLRVDDTGTTNPRVRAYEAISDVNATVSSGPFPTLVQSPSGGYWPGNATGSNKRWAIIGDERFFIYWTCGGPNTTSGWGVYFGDIQGHVGFSDPFNTVLYAPASDYNNYGGDTLQDDISRLNPAFSTSVAAAIYSPRAHTGLGVAVNMGQGLAWGSSDSATHWSGSNQNIRLYYPNPITFKLQISELVTWQPSSGVWRGKIPGLFGVNSRTTEVPGAFSIFQLLTNLDGGLAGRTAMVLHTGLNYYASPDPAARTLVDLVGPWRA